MRSIFPGYSSAPQSTCSSNGVESRLGSSSRTALLAAGLFAVVTCIATPASARPEYPGKVQKAVATQSGKAVCTPTCLLCHTDPAGGAEHLRQVNYGSALAVAASGDASSLASSNTDTDTDGKSDFEELVAGTDPFATGSQSICTPEYGCGARIAPAASSNRATAGAAGIFAAALATYLVRRPRRRAAK